jgi:7-cyano-7-deazaguanine synthase
MAKAIVILSGGMDSTVLLHHVVAAGYEVYGLSFDYGQRHRKELEMARYWGKKLCKEWKCLSLLFMQEIASNSALMDHSKELPKEHYTHENQQITVVPNRNMVMLSIAIAWAENIEAEAVYFGAHANDNTIYPDCRPAFVKAIDSAARKGTYRVVEVRAPFILWTKREVALRGKELGVDFDKTWSCYAGEEEPCGVCATCQERIDALSEI